eukprot:Colp12_sorted_trinity150504_noHs@16947
MALVFIGRFCSKNFVARAVVKSKRPVLFKSLLVASCRNPIVPSLFQQTYTTFNMDSAKATSATYSKGLDTYKVSMRLHAENRSKLVKQMSDAPKNGVCLFLGGETSHRYETDMEHPFRQESTFLYLFGVHEANCLAAIDLADGASTLFIPRLPEEYAVWMGEIYPPSHFVTKYEVDFCRFVDEIPEWMASRQPETIYVVEGINSDSGSNSKPAAFDGIAKYNVDRSRLYYDVAECRVRKTKAEVDLMRWVNSISSKAHMEVMRKVRVGMMEYQLESEFMHQCYTHGGMRFLAYTCICGCGVTGATLHYPDNDKQIADGAMCLLDMGAEYHGYASDITCSFPASGKFSQDQKDVYNTVLEAQRAVEAAMKPGVSWPAMHRLSERVLLEGLANRGILQGSIDEMVAANLAYYFMPHGLGHMLGLDVHDVGGYVKGDKRSTEPGLNRLRTNRVLEEGMVLTVEPGLYFIKPLLAKLYADPAVARFATPRLRDFENFGGVRLEDNVVVTATGIELLTKVPRTIEEIEAVMAQQWTPA